MDQNQTMENQASVDNDLQKAIDNITNTTNADPVFSDPVAAPSSVPEGDTGELAESVGPFPAPKVEMPAPAAEPLAPLGPISIPDLEAPEPEEPATPEPTKVPEPEEPVTSEMHSLSTTEVKRAALRDLLPLLDKIRTNETQKFNIYKDIFEELKDYTVLEPAYQAAREIPNETERAEALLYLVEAIDKM